MPPRGLRVPDACRIVWFDDVAMARYLHPPLTMAHKPMPEMGRTATQMLQARIEERVFGNHVLLPELVVRESSAPVDA